MKVLVVLPEKAPFVKDIEPGLVSLQREVKGCIEVVYPFDDNACIICNEDGKLLKMDLNRALRDENGDVYDIVAGKFLVVGLGEDDFTDLTPEQQCTYAEMFVEPEMFICCNGEMKVFPATELSEKCEDVIDHYFEDEEIEI